MQSFELDKTDLLRIKTALEADDADLENVLKEYHASEIAILFEKLQQEEKERIINILPADVASEVLSEMDEEHGPAELLVNLDPEKRTEIVEELDYDDATDIISQLDEEHQEEILEDLDHEDASSIRALMTYAEDTAGGLMNSEIIKVNINLDKKDALDEIIRQSEEMEEFYTICVVDNDDILKGILSIKTVIKARADARISDLVTTDFVYVKAELDQEEVARLIKQYNLTSIPVVDDHMKLLGRVTVDDIIDVMEEENTEDILKISGVSEDEELSGNWLEAVKSRLPWLVINLGTAFLAASIIRTFDSTVAKLSIISAYMTIIAGMGGNAATQALAVTVRRISLSDLSDKQAYNTVLKEFLVGLINGAANGLIVFIVAFFYDANPLLGLVLFLAMTGNLIIAGLTGASIPLILKRVGIDPAVASSIIITTFTDCIGFLLPLWLATKLLLK
ncbi:magnesium transporter [Mucilaginibacter rubeus]|uniref:Magnesium transporter MgtE n=1 Tax=Mucilaginibacter rubeus TaxID=2027860 RepID=A0AAE6MHX3_9SPHI|nr:MULTISPECIES: magnesium transporter [Mucilaginibacter]QEM03963.1 magnesium transporter [Mucilaginibacter rubeus]QEM16572.1 magnesium transporter [Mucilaginibacter gossypii]QTE40654.1 magnesium transporter [Mucilaginibacter rubeus]QTE47256.1 magnesium transporter [Mucilaginibacter rubeus]QTE58649.1 magnesium transporter [Mucilaginibacter rubeus]